MIAPVLIALVVLLLVAKLGGDLFERLGQPAVLGELLFGVVLGNLGLIGFERLDHLKDDFAIELLAELGVILLLFEVGLESNLREMLSVGLSSLLVAVLGVVVPMILGLGVSEWFRPGASFYFHLFVGATLSATSVGITARVLQDLGRSQTREARIVLGAAVIDDVLALVVLATVTGLITAAAGGGAGVSVGMVALIVGKAFGFVAGSVAIGYVASPVVLRLAARFRVRGMLLTTSLLMCFLLAYLAHQVGLAPIVGAFAAGLIIDDHAEAFRAHGGTTLHETLSPLVTFLVPLFFVRMGLLVDLQGMGNFHVVEFAAVLTAAALIGKQVCALGVRERGINRLAVGIGMIPRGEVGLIFGNIGAAMLIDGKPVIDPEEFSSIVIMVMITTLVTPPLLRWSFARGKS
ncbi:MAG: cation:proton antiporter [Deltaproteobacteria bacterium]|nr:cation:proton antiporter [Deltaproteobacteria bacterium]MBI3388835.1 cation:proton antiporter [Deltaproteobacteria bacterium]